MKQTKPILSLGAFFHRTVSLHVFRAIGEL